MVLQRDTPVVSALHHMEQQYAMSPRDLTWEHMGIFEGEGGEAAEEDSLGAHLCSRDIVRSALGCRIGGCGRSLQFCVYRLRAAWWCN